MEIPPFEDLFKLIKINLKIIGITFNKSPNKLLFYSIALSIAVMCFQEGGYIVSRISTEDLVVLTQIAPCTIIGSLSLIKILYVYFQRDKIFELTNVLGELYGQILLDKVKVDCVKKEVLQLKLLTKYYFVLNMALTSTYMILPLGLMLHGYATEGSVTFILTYSLLTPFVVNTWLRWIVIYFQSVICGFVCVIFFATVDILFCNLTCQVCINFSILSNELENLAVDDGDKLRDIVKRHQYLLELSQDLEDIFSGTNFFNVLAQALIICSLLFNLNAGDLANVPGCLVFLSSAVFQILMMSVFGERLIHESQRIGDAVFLCKWYEMSPSNKKTIIIIRQRAMKPSVLTAYKFSVIGYACFSKIIRTSWSFFTLLSTVYDK